MRTLTNFNKTNLHSINFKTIFSVVALICFTQIGFGQGLEDFSNCTAGTSYSNSNFLGNDGITWTYIASRDEANTAGVTVPGLMLRRVSDGSKVTSSTISGGIGDFSVKLYKGFTGGGNRQVELFVNGVSQGTSTPFDNYDEQIFMVSGINQPGDVIIELRNTTAKQIIVDDIEWTAFSGSVPPGITLGAVSGNTSEDGTTATFTAVLDTAPTSDVVLDVSSDYPGEVSFDLSQLTFIAANWDTPQTITITGLDDSDVDGDIDVTITVAVDDANSDATYAGISETTTVTNEDNELPPLIINEFLADPNGASGDANGDAVVSTSQDEFIEIYNTTLIDIDVSGYMINDSSGLRHTFTSGSVIPAGEVIVVFGGGTPTNIPCLSQTASVGFLGLNNGGDTITLFDASSVVVTSYSYGSEGGDNQSLGRDVDITGDFIKHSQITSNPVDFSPGRYNETNIPFSAVTWTGATSSDWATTSNWSAGAVPTSSDIVFIDGTFTNEPTISSIDAVAQSVTVASGNTLTIDQSSSLTVSGDFTNSGTVILNSTADDFSSLIVEGSATGDITYNRFVNSYNDGLGGGWDLVCSPVNMTIADFITANGANIQVLGDDYAFSQYDNALGQWVRYATASQTGSFTAGQGYSMATTAGATVAFTGTMQTTDQSIDIINNNGLNGVGRRWNLVSNPFPSYINGNTTAEAVNNFMDVNSGVIDGSFLGVYGWNGSSYTTYNNTSDAFSIAPGQGFWIAALNTANTPLDFTTAMRTTTGSGDFVQGPQPLVYKLELKLFNEQTQKAATKFYFRDGLSLDLDPGYDAGAFNQSAKLSTRLPQGSQEFAFEINAMGMDAMQNTRVPLEIRQNAGQAFRVSMTDVDLPEDIYVYLEDTLNGTLTSLKDQDFELEAQSNLSGVDRFFILFKSNSVLSNGDTLGVAALNVYKANTDSFVTITGITPDLGQLDVTLYNIIGQTVREKALNPTTATQNISTQGLASGLYMVQVKSGSQTTVRKVMVK
ncbi:lamin tail domain-containing protein [Flavobacteriaceae bacterium]|nr:lamin tail domain-containing protein [Flavobacteriaceae bacterium]